MKKISMIFAIFMLYGCGSDSTGNGAIDNNSETEANRALEIIGTWESVDKCVKVMIERNDIYYQYVQYTIEFGDKGYTANSFNYTDAACTQKASVYLKNQKTYSIGKEVISSSGLIATEIEFNRHKVFHVYNDHGGERMVQEYELPISKIIYVDNNSLYFGTSPDDPDNPGQIDFESAFERID